MDKATRLILNVIGGKVGLTAEQVKEEARAGTLDDRYQTCKSCRFVDCSRCQIVFSQTKKITH